VTRPLRRKFMKEEGERKTKKGDALKKKKRRRREKNVLGCYRNPLSRRSQKVGGEPERQDGRRKARAITSTPLVRGKTGKKRVNRTERTKKKKKWRSVKRIWTP